ncbi:MAG: MFS transporter [Pseudoclavibacter sp.]
MDTPITITPLDPPLTPRSTRSPGLITALLACAGIVASLTQTLVIPLIGTLPSIFHASSSLTAWTVTATLLTGAVAMPVLGRLADMHGKRRMILITLIPLALGSVLCAVATTLPVMIVGRALQGVANGLVPLGISLLHDVLPRERIAGAIALMSASMGIGGALGLPIASAVIQYTNWRILFWATAALAVLVGAGILALIPRDLHRRRTGGFDLVGALGIAIGLVCLLLGVSQGGVWGWGSPLTIGAFAIAAAVLLVWGWLELRHRSPLVDLRTTARPAVLFTDIASLLTGIAMYSQSLLIPQLLQLPTATGYGLGQSMFRMGLWMAPSGLAMMLISPLGARITDRHGPKATFVAGGLTMAVGYLVALLFMSTPWGLLAATVVISAGLSFSFGAMPALILGNVPPAQKAAANSLNGLVRSIGTSTSAAIIGAVLSLMSVQAAPHVTIPTEAAFRVGFLIGLGVSLLAATTAALTPLSRPQSPAAADTQRVGKDGVEGGRRDPAHGLSAPLRPVGHLEVD